MGSDPTFSATGSARQTTEHEITKLKTSPEIPSPRWLPLHRLTPMKDEKCLIKSRISRQAGPSAYRPPFGYPPFDYRSGQPGLALCNEFTALRLRLLTKTKHDEKYPTLSIDRLGLFQLGLFHYSRSSPYILLASSTSLDLCASLCSPASLEADAMLLT